MASPTELSSPVLARDFRVRAVGQHADDAFVGRELGEPFQVDRRPDRRRLVDFEISRVEHFARAACPG